jgi:hypothetical protein
VYRRYLEREGTALQAIGVTDASSFSTYYWAQQVATAELLIVVPTLFALAGGVVYGLTRPRKPSGVAAVAGS